MADYVLCWRGKNWAPGKYSVSNRTWKKEEVPEILLKNRQDYPERQFWVEWENIVEEEMKKPLPGPE